MGACGRAKGCFLVLKASCSSSLSKYRRLSLHLSLQANVLLSRLVFCDLNFPWKCPEPLLDVLPCPVPVLEGTHSAPWPLAKNCEWPVIPGRSLWLCCVGCYYTHPASAFLELNMYKAVCRILCPPENFNDCLSLEWGEELKYSELGSPGNQHFKFSFPLLGLNLS